MSRKLVSKKSEFINNYPSVAKFVFKKKTFIENKIDAQLKKVANQCANATTPPTCASSEADKSPPSCEQNINIGNPSVTIQETCATAEADELITLKNKYKICEQSLKVAKKLLRESSQLNLEKDLKIQQITSQKENSNESDEILFETFSKHFDPPDLHEIRSVGSGVKKDSTFIYKIMNSFYKNNLDKLYNRSATGKKYKGITKHEITFEKKEVMEKMLTERVKWELRDQSCSSKEFLTRVNRLNKLVRFAIGNLLPKKDIDQNQNVMTI